MYEVHDQGIDIVLNSRIEIPSKLHSSIIKFAQIDVLDTNSVICYSYAFCIIMRRDVT